MRWVVRSLLAIAGLVGLGFLGVDPLAALAAPVPSPAPAPAAVGRAGPGKPVCTLNDSQSRLISLSGMAATANGYVVVNDSTGSAARDRVFFLDTSCKVVKTVPYPSPPNDPEDVAISKDGTVIWVADIGDNDKKRTTIGLWRVPASGTGRVTLYRMRYPDGKHDAEALLLDADDQPIIVTKDAGGSGIYKPTGALVPNSTQGVALAKVGEFRPRRTGTSNWGGFIGQLQVTGGANSPDRTKVALRTYSDAYEWDVPDGDVVKAITTGKPRETPLPDEPMGEAIAYSPDGERFLTVSDMENQPGDVPPDVLQYTPATEVRATPSATGAAPKRNAPAWYNRLSLAQWTWLIAGVGTLGLLLVVAGVVGIVHARRSPTWTGRSGGGRERMAGWADEDKHSSPMLTAVGEAGAGAEPYAGGEYRSGEYPGAEYRGGEYRGGEYPGAEYRGGEYRGGEYGGGEYRGGEYGGGEYRGGEYRGGEYRGGDQYRGREYPGAEYQGGEYRG